MNKKSITTCFNTVSFVIVRIFFQPKLVKKGGGAFYTLPYFFPGLRPADVVCNARCMETLYSLLHSLLNSHLFEYLSIVPCIKTVLTSIFAITLSNSHLLTYRVVNVCLSFSREACTCLVGLLSLIQCIQIYQLRWFVLKRISKERTPLCNYRFFKWKSVP